jgi:hypothetical protein
MRLSGRAAMGGDAPNPALGSKKGPPRVQHRGSARSLLTTTTTTTRTHPVTIMHLLSSAAYGSISLSWSPPQRPQMRMPCSDAVALALAGLDWAGLDAGKPQAYVPQLPTSIYWAPSGSDGAWYHIFCIVFSFLLSTPLPITPGLPWMARCTRGAVIYVSRYPI